MKNFDSRTYSINDFVEWDRNKQLELSPRFQRRSVWSDNARSYLMDTIINGKPIPKVFIRQKINATTKTSIREVVDGQQRLRTILSYIGDGFQINKRHNSKYGGLFFSQLGEVDPEIQASILDFEIAVDLLVNMSDPEVLDVFSRLNSYAVLLNDQERINANHFGPFKTLADKVGREYFEFWIKNGIITEKQIMRMDEVELAADLLIAMIEGIKAKNQIKSYYAIYEKKFDYDPDILESKFRATMIAISSIFGETLRTSEFKRVSLFYSLYTAIYHLLYGVRDLNAPRIELDSAKYERYRVRLERIDELFVIDDKDLLNEDERQFIEDSRRATTDASTRVRRTNFIINTIAK